MKDFLALCLVAFTFGVLVYLSVIVTSEKPSNEKKYVQWEEKEKSDGN